MDAGIYIYIFKSFIYNSDKENLYVKIHIKDICIKCSIVLCMQEYICIYEYYIWGASYINIYIGSNYFHAFIYIYKNIIYNCITLTKNESPV